MRDTLAQTEVNSDLYRAGTLIFLLFDGRAMAGDTDDATVMDTADSVKEAWAASRQCWRNVCAIWYEYKFDDKGEVAVEVGRRWDIGKGILLWK